MPSFNRYISSSADDGYSNHDGTQFSNSQHYVHQGYYVSTSLFIRSFYRFQNVTIPQGSALISAYIKFRAYSDKDDITINYRIYCENSDDTTPPSNGTDLINRPLTSAYSEWNNVEAWITGDYYNSSDFVNVLSEVINRPGWASGNSITIHILDNGTDAEIDHLRTSTAYDFFAYYGYGDPAELIIEHGIIYDSINLAENTSIKLEGIHAYQPVKIREALSISKLALQPLDIHDDISLSENTTQFIDILSSEADEIGINDISQAYDFKKWYGSNKDRMKRTFILTLTGDADNTTDLELIVKDFRGSKRTGYQNYLNIIIEGSTYETQIRARINGTMKVEAGFIVNNEIALREYILEADLNEINIYDNVDLYTIELTGYKLQSYAPNYIELIEDARNYRGYVKEKITYRIPYIDPFLNPGDTVKIDDDQFIVDAINYTVKPLNALMEIRQ